MRQTNKAAIVPSVPKSYLFPPVPTPVSLVTLTADTAFSVSLLGSIVDLNGHELNLGTIDGSGVTHLTGAGTYAGALVGELEAGETLPLTVIRGTYTVTGASAPPSIGDISIGSISGLAAALAGKAPVSHTHAQGEVTDLAADLAAKASNAALGLLQDELEAKADASHIHNYVDIAGLQDVLDGKADAAHTHAQSEVTDLTTALAGKAAASHIHAIADITDLEEELASAGGGIPAPLTLAERPEDDVLVVDSDDPGINSKIRVRQLDAGEPISVQLLASTAPFPTAYNAAWNSGTRTITISLERNSSLNVVTTAAHIIAHPPIYAVPPGGTAPFVIELFPGGDGSGIITPMALTAATPFGGTPGIHGQSASYPGGTSLCISAERPYRWFHQADEQHAHVIADIQDLEDELENAGMDTIPLTAPPVQGVLAVPAVQAQIQVTLNDIPISDSIFQVGGVAFTFQSGITVGSADSNEIIVDGTLEEVAAHFLSQLQNHPGLSAYTFEPDDSISLLGYVNAAGVAGNSLTADTDSADISINGVSAPSGTSQNFTGGANLIPAITGTVGALGQLAIATIGGSRKYSFRCIATAPMTWEAATPGVLFNTTLNAWRRTLLSGADAAEVTTTEAL